MKMVPILMAAAVVVLLLALSRLGEAVKQLRLRTESLEKPHREPVVASPPRPMLGALMEHRESPLAGLGRWPGGRLAVVAGALALLAAVVAFAAGGPRSDPKEAQELSDLRHRLDSVTAIVTKLKDSQTPSVLASASPASEMPKTAVVQPASPKQVPSSSVRPRTPAKKSVAAAPPAKGPAQRKVGGGKLPPAPSLSGATIAPPTVDSIH
jgi:hypothetical protein